MARKVGLIIGGVLAAAGVALIVSKARGAAPAEPTLFEYASDTRLIPYADRYQWLEVDIANIDDHRGTCHSRDYGCAENNYGEYSAWRPVHEGQDLVLNAGETGTFVVSERRNYPNLRYYYAVAGDAGIISTPGSPPILPCVLCYEETGEYTLYRTQEQLNAHIASAHV